ncbi:MAG: iron-sulfur cluster assembly scaffold protein [Metamycoplasmataceae bacterium]
MKHYLNPLNRKEKILNIEDYESAYHHSDTCADDVTIFINKKNNELLFQGNGCAIFIASADLFIENIKKTRISIEELNTLYKKVIEKEELSEEEKNKVDNLIIFENIKNQMNRYECALMISKVIEKVLYK